MRKRKRSPATIEATRVAALLEGADKATRKLVLHVTKAVSALAAKNR